MKNVLTIAGSDTCGGAGIQADLKTFSAHCTYGMSVITAVTVQNTQGVFDCQDINKEIIGKQIEAIFDDIEVSAVKIGMVSKIDTINIIADKIEKYKPKNVVIDPVMVSKHGFELLKLEAKDLLIKRLIPLAYVLTPNIPEAEAITGIRINNIDDMKFACKKIYDMGAKNIFLKGGHLEKNEAIDILFEGNEFFLLESNRIQTKNTHGTGCTISSAIASNLANGMSVKDAVKEAKKYITVAIKHSLNIGKGIGPTNHFYTLFKKAGIRYE